MRFYNGKIDIFDKSMKERVRHLIDASSDKELLSIDILELFHDFIQTEREECKLNIESDIELNDKDSKEKWINEDLSLMRLQKYLKNQRKGGVNF